MKKLFCRYFGWLFAVALLAACATPSSVPVPDPPAESATGGSEPAAGLHIGGRRTAPPS